MSYFTEPFGLCEEAHAVALLDQTKGQCMLEHGCPPARNYPLHGCFVGISGITGAEALQSACHRGRKNS